MELLNPLHQSIYPARSAAFTATAGVTADWPPGPEGVMVWADQPCYVIVGEGVTATTGATPIPANTPIPFKVPNSQPGTLQTGGPWHVSAVQLGALGGTVYCKPINSK